MYILIKTGQITQCMTNLQKSVTKIFTSVAGDQHKTPILPIKRQAGVQTRRYRITPDCVCFNAFEHPKQRINHRIAGDRDG